jgi:hypothetical protein
MEIASRSRSSARVSRATEIRSRRDIARARARDAIRDTRSDRDEDTALLRNGSKP